MNKLTTKLPLSPSGRFLARHAASAPLKRLQSLSPSSTASYLRSPPSSNFSTTTSARAANQIFDPVRNVASFQTYLSLSTSANRPFLTLWTASWCSTCRIVEPRIRAAVEAGAGQDQGGVNYAVVEFDSPDASELVARYLTSIRSVPTLLAFDARRGEPVAATRVVDARSLGDAEFLEAWIRNEAARHGGGGGGGDGTTGFGGLFGGWKK